MNTTMILIFILLGLVALAEGSGGGETTATFSCSALAHLLEKHHHGSGSSAATSSGSGHEEIDPLLQCLSDSCTASPEEADHCLKRITFPEHDLELCEMDVCLCYNGGDVDSWDCLQQECRRPCEKCECAATDSGGAGSINCEGARRICKANVYKKVLDMMFGFGGCNETRECLGKSQEEKHCHDLYHDCTTDEQDKACTSSLAVEEVIYGPRLSCVLESCEDVGGHHSHPYNILILTAMIALGNLCRYFGGSFPLKYLPYTVQVFLIGAGWGFMCENITSLKEYGELGNIDPHLMFYIFLPILIFESAFATDFHVFKKVKLHCIILAGPGLIICSGLTALCAKFIFTEYKWNTVTCLLFGCMLSATDPVAVVALLKELGAAPTISQLIEGESLLNDGTAIVFFNLFEAGVAKGEVKEGMGEIILIMIKVAGGGAVLGWVVGIIVKNCIKRVFNDPEIEITLTLVAAYATFFCAEAYLYVSGVLGLVVMGMYLAYHSHVISPEVEHSLHHFWEIIVYIGNTMIFAIAGIVISEKAFEQINGYDFYYLLINYLLLNLIRGFSLFLLRPLMNFKGTYQLDWRNGLLCTWGGLRGAVGLALALIVAGDEKIACYSVGNEELKFLGGRFLFHVAGIVILTLCVNGVTTGMLVSKLGLGEVAEDRKRAMHRTYGDLVKYIDDDLYEMRRQPVFRDANWTAVKSQVHKGLQDAHNKNRYEPFENPEAMHDACLHYYELYAHAVEHEYEGGTMLPSSLRRLLSYLDDVKWNAEEHNDYQMVGSHRLESEFRLSWFDNSMPNGQNKRWQHAFDIGIGFLQIHEAILKSIDGVCYSPQGSNQVKSHCKTVRKETIVLLERFSNQKPEIAMALTSRNAARTVLNRARNFAKLQDTKGKIAPNDRALLTGMLETNMRRVMHMPITLRPEENEKTLVDVCPWYTAHGPSHVVLRGRYGSRHFNTGDNVIGRSDGHQCFVILAGVVRVHIGNRAENFGPGYTAGLMSVLTGQTGKYSEVFAETPTEVAIFEATSIREQCAHREFAAAIWDDCCKSVARKVMSCLPSFREWSHVKIKNFVSTGRRYPVAPSEAYPTAVPQDSVPVLITGEYKDVLQGRESGTGPCFVPPSLSAALFTTSSVLFVIGNPLTASEKARKYWAKIRNKIFTVRAIACLQGHDAGLRAVKEVLEGRITSLFPKAQAEMAIAQQQPLSVQGSQSEPSVAPSQSVAPKSPSTVAVASPMSVNGNHNNYSVVSDAPNGKMKSSRSKNRNSSRKYRPISPSYGGYDLTDLTQSFPDMNENTPWFSQTEKPHRSRQSSHRNGSPSNGSRSFDDNLGTPLLDHSPNPLAHRTQSDDFLDLRG
eukprot:TRINITY_DN2267_c1_g1_i2.p1 TRINITY_DN2267_c1_g1~~TRINITY_DN2267_c1_g1_i2.p1  ORF type:complete len:1348 (+),score=249.35 TRINITY_DN2267_c1_g1_i2:43-4086(+)